LFTQGPCCPWPLIAREHEGHVGHGYAQEHESDDEYDQARRPERYVLLRIRIGAAIWTVAGAQRTMSLVRLHQNGFQEPRNASDHRGL